ncbi:MAG: hypothetical protein JWM11_8026 [Planctomycetaceae bacterium]|nr:hypothetical protein [Planctomycetaceae bacterium]
MFDGFLLEFFQRASITAIVLLTLIWLLRLPRLAWAMKYVVGFLLLCARARFSILTGLILVALPLVAVRWPGMAGGVFILRRGAQLGFVTWATLMISLLVFVTFRVNGRTAPDRFGDVSGANIPKFGGLILRPTWGWWSWCEWVLMGLSVPGFCFYTTLAESDAMRAKSVESTADGLAKLTTLDFGPSPIELGYGLALGILGGTFTLLVLVVLQRLLFSERLTKSGLLPFESLKWLDKLPNFGAKIGPALGSFVVPYLGPRVYEPVDGQNPPPYVSNGYFRLTNPTDINSWELEHGHAQVGLMWALLTLIHLTFYAVGSALISLGYLDIPSQDGVLTALFFVIVALFFVGFTLTEVSFFLDYYRVPTLIPVALLFLISYQFWGVDHVYDLNPPTLAVEKLEGKGQAATSELIPQQIELKNVFGMTGPQATPDTYWNLPRYHRKRTLVVITAAGGGIQAAAWTARVLTGLDQRFQGFSESVGIVSSVSGGTVGSMFYLLYRGERKDAGNSAMKIPEAVRKAINDDSMASGLESAFWGLAIPDLIRLTFPPAVPQDLDRGWALEMDWRRRMMLYLDKTQTTGSPQDLPDRKQKWKDFRLLDWVAKIREKKMPVPVFNSTILETGQRMMLSPVTAFGPDEVYSDDPLSGVEFFRCYSLGSFRPNPLLITAARLSATFSYVSPVCRPKTKSIPHHFGNEIKPEEIQDFRKRLHWHLADGGYSDNEGIVTATKWVRQLLLGYRNEADPAVKPPFDRVLLIRINGFPDQVSTPDEKAQARPPSNKSSGSGFGDALLGPVLTLSSVRVATQAERGDYEMKLLEQATQARQRAEIGAYFSAAGVDLETVPEEVISAARSDPAQALQSALELANPSSKDKQTPKANVPAPAASDADKRVKRARPRLPREVEVRSIKFQYPANLPYPPLSWSLTPTEKQLLDQAWKQIEKELEEPIDRVLPSEALSLSPKHLKAFFPAW